MKTEFLRTHCNKKWICRLVAVLFVLSLVPTLWIARYDHPCADDFSYGKYTAEVWRETGSLRQTLDAAISGVEAVYDTWQGSFSAVFLMTLHPAVFHEQSYALVPVLLILGLMASTLFLLKVVLMDYFGADRHSFGIIGITVAFLSMQFVVSPVEAFYWYNGAMYYTGFHCLALVLFTLVLLSFRAKRPLSIGLYGSGVAVLGFVIGGGNFVTALTGAVVMGSFAVYLLTFKKGRWVIPLLGLLTLCAGLIISAAAPGNAIRQENFQGMGPMPAIVQSFWYALRFIRYFVRVPALLGFGCITPLLYKIARGSGYAFRWPGLVTAFLFGVFASSFTPNLYAMSSLGPARVVNVNHYLFLLFFLFLLFYWCGWIGSKFPHAPKNKGGSKRQEDSMERGSVGLLTVCFALGCLIVCGADVDAMTSVSAARSLVTGEARIYHEENLARQEKYHDPAVTDIVVPAFTHKPHVLFFDDITANSEDWRNKALTAYYNKETARIETPGESGAE